MEEFYSELVNCKIVLEAAGAHNLLYSAFAAERVFARLPRDLQRSFAKLVMPSLFDGHASTITRFAACALFRAWPILIMNVCF